MIKILALILALALCVGGAYIAYGYLAEKSGGSNLQFVGGGSGTQSGTGSGGESGTAPGTQGSTEQNPILKPPAEEPPPTETTPEQTPPVQESPAQKPPVQDPPAKDPTDEEMPTEDLSQPKPPEAELVPPVSAPTVSDFTVYDTIGNAVKLSDYFGKPIVLNFFSVNCAPCLNEMPAFQSHYISNRETVTFLFICLDSNFSAVAKYLSDRGYTFPIVHDRSGSAAAAYKVTSIPSTFFIDRNGTLAAWAVGTLKYADISTGISKIK